MYFSFQSDSVAYDAENARFWAMFLTREWNMFDKGKNRIEPNRYFKERYGIILDDNERGIVIGIAVPDHIYTLLLLQYADSI
jgi:hypothetical protein